MFSAVITASHDLLVTKGARRRLRIELERATPDTQSVAIALADYRRIADQA